MSDFADDIVRSNEEAIFRDTAARPQFIQLLACPFCNGEAVKPGMFATDDQWGVRCSMCGASVRSGSWFGAVQNWNTRGGYSSIVATG